MNSSPALAWASAMLLMTAALFFGQAANADDWRPIPPEELRMTELPEAVGAPAVILYKEVNRNDGISPHEDIYVRIKVLKEEGRKYANVEIPFVKNSVNIHGVKGRSVRMDGSVVPFDGKVMEQTIVKAKGMKYLAKTFTLPDVQVGSIIEYRYTADFSYIFDSKWVLSQELFTKYARFELKANPDYTLRWSYPLGLPTGTEQAKNEHGAIRMETRNVPGFQEEDYMPPETALKYRVDFIYTDEISAEKDPVKYWKQFGKQQSEAVEQFSSKKKAMEQAVAQTVSPGDAPEVKLQKIYARVQQIRNLGYEKEKTEQEQKREKQKEINSVEDVWKHGYGSGRQITWLFMGMARAAGFEAAPVLVSRRNESFFNNAIMNPRDLDDNIVYVKVGAKEMYFDPGTLFTPYGMLPWWETNVQGLKLAKDGGTWVEIPLSDSDTTKIERHADLKLSPEGTLQGKLKVIYWGSEAQSLRIDQRNEDETNRKKLLEDMVKEMVPVGIDIELANQPDWKSSANDFVAEFTIKIPGWVAGAGKRALLPVGLFSATEKGVFDNAVRIHPVYFHFPYKKIDDIKIELPLGWKLGSLAKPAERDVKAAAYNMRAEDQGGNLHLTRFLRSDLIMIPTPNYPALRSFFQFIRIGDEEQVVLQPGSTVTVN